MKKQAKMKSAVITSIIAMLLSVAMLFGTTFAWFTDSVTNTNNIIKSGNIDVELWHCNCVDAMPIGFGYVEANGEEVKGDTKLFLNKDGEQILWEPGAQAGETFRIKNMGSLALKYEFRIVNYIETETAEANKISDILGLEAIQFEYNEYGTPFNPENGECYAGTFKDGYVIEGALKAGEMVDYWIGIDWTPSEKDNDYNVASGLSLRFGVELVATQFTFEKDGFNGDSYDQNAEYPVFDVWDGTTDTSWYNDTDTEFTLATAEQFAGFAELVDGGNTFAGKTIKLDKDLDLRVIGENGEPISFEPIGSFSDNTAFKGTFDGQGHTISNLYQNGWALENGYWDGPEYGMGLFSLVENASIKNVNFDGASLPTEANIMGVVAGGAANSVFENINITNAYLGNHSWYSGGAIGWAEKDIKLINCDIDASSVVSSQWGDFNNANGGLIGGIDPEGTYYFKDCDVACVIDAYNDVTSAYEWYSYRSCGMLIGDTGTNDDEDEDNVGYATALKLTCENVTVTYGEWANYHYCEFSSSGYPFCRVEAGESTGAYGNARVGEYFDANGNKVVDDNHVHNDGEKHHELIVFDQLYGGVSGDRYCTYGTATHPGVTVIYNNK